MRKLLLILVLVVIAHAPVVAASEWQVLFNGRNLEGWKANVYPESFRVVDGAIRVQATKPSAHLFYVGKESGDFRRFKDFELEATVRSEASSNSGIFFHTDYSVSNAKNHLARGYEVQLNSAPGEKRKTGSLYGIVDLDRSPVNEKQWFKVRIRVQGKRITVHLNNQQVVDYTEPESPERPAGRKGRVLDPTGGAIAIQAHDPDSIFYFKEIRIREL